MSRLLPNRGGHGVVTRSRPHAVRAFVGVCLWATLATATGCAPHRTLAEVFPPGSMAAPWVLQDAVWTGTIEEATPGLGADAADWRKYDPQRVWLAVYRHEQRPDRTLKVRCFSFASADAAGRAYAAAAPLLTKPYTIGDGGAWTENGVVFRWGRLIFEVFGTAGGWDSEQAGLLTAFIARRMPPDLPGDPR